MSIEKLSFVMSVEFNGRLNGIQIGSMSSWRKRSAKAYMCMKEDNKPWNQQGTATSFDSEDLWSSIAKYINNENLEPGLDVPLKENGLGLSDSFFEDASTFLTEKEKPSEYSPPPPISETDMAFNAKLENALYILKDLLSSPVRKSGMENELSAAWMLIHDEVKFEDPVLCTSGKERLARWLNNLAENGASVDLQEIYAENINACPRRGCIYAVWTLSFLTQHKEVSDPYFTNPQKLTISGETKFDLNSSGQITSIRSQWHIKEEKIRDFIKEYFGDMLLKAEI